MDFVFTLEYFPDFNDKVCGNHICLAVLLSENYFSHAPNGFKCDQSTIFE